jgi:hypothetical protein
MLQYWIASNVLKSRGMYLAANENLESKDLWQPDSQGCQLEKLAR